MQGVLEEYAKNMKGILGEYAGDAKGNMQEICKEYCAGTTR